MMRTWRRGAGGSWPTLRPSRCRLRHLVRRLAGRHGHPVGYRNRHVVRSRQAGKAEAHPRGPDMAWPTGPALAEHACSALERASTRPLVSRAGFDQLLAVGFGVVVAHAAAESPDTSGKVAHGVGYATRSEQEQNDGEHDQPVSEAQRPHDSGSRRGRYVRRTARLSCVEGSCAGGRSRRRPTGKDRAHGRSHRFGAGPGPAPAPRPVSQMRPRLDRHLHARPLSQARPYAARSRGRSAAAQDGPGHQERQG